MAFQAECEGRRELRREFRDAWDVGSAGGQYDTGSAPFAFEYGEHRIGCRRAGDGNTDVEPLRYRNREAARDERVRCVSRRRRSVLP